MKWMTLFATYRIDAFALEPWLNWDRLLACTLDSSLAILAFLLMRQLFHRHVPAKWLHWATVLLVVKLIFFVSISTSWSVLNFINPSTLGISQYRQSFAHLILADEINRTPP